MAITSHLPLFKRPVYFATNKGIPLLTNEKKGLLTQDTDSI